MTGCRDQIKLLLTQQALISCGEGVPRAAPRDDQAQQAGGDVQQQDGGEASYDPDHKNRLRASCIEVCPSGEHKRLQLPLLT